MFRTVVAGLAAGVSAVMALASVAVAQAPQTPLYNEVEGTDNVYIFRYGGHQSMFVVTKDGVIATDPIGLRRPAAKPYIENPESYPGADQIRDL